MRMDAGVEPVTLAQAGLFVAEEQSTTDGPYNLPIRLEVRGAVPEDRLAAACRTLSAGTAALRVRMGLADTTGEIVQWFAPDPPEVLLRAAPESPAAVDALLAHATLRRFEVDEGPLARFLVLRTAPDRATVLLVVHHLVSDGVSHVRLAERLAGCLVGATVLVQDEPAYVELVRRVRAAEQKARLVDQAYWFDRVRPLDLAELPVTAGLLPSRSARQLLEFDADLVSRLREAGSAAGVSFFALLVAAVHAALPVPAGGRTVLCAAASQRPTESGDVVANAVNEVPLTADRAVAGSVLELARAEGPGWAEDLRRRNHPYIDLVHHVTRHGGPGASLNRVMMAYRRLDRTLQVRAGSVSCSADLNFRFPIAKTELAVRVFDHGAVLQCEVQWNERLPDPDGERFSRSFAAVLADCVGRTPPAAVPA